MRAMIAVPKTLTLKLGGQDKAALLEQLAAHDIALNDHARTLFASSLFQPAVREHDIRVCSLPVAALGLTQGGSWPQLIAAAAELGMRPCPLEAAVALRLLPVVLPAEKADPLTGSGRAPAGALTVVSEPLTEDEDFPRGLYLRDLDGVRWLRGYRSDDTHVWQPDAHLLWQMQDGA